MVHTPQARVAGKVTDESIHACRLVSEASCCSPAQIGGEIVRQFLEKLLFFLMYFPADIDAAGSFFLAESSFVVKQNNDLSKGLDDLVQAASCAGRRGRAALLWLLRASRIGISRCSRVKY